MFELLHETDLSNCGRRGTFLGVEVDLLQRDEFIRDPRTTLIRLRKIDVRVSEIQPFESEVELELALWTVAYYEEYSEGCQLSSCGQVGLYALNV